MKENVILVDFESSKEWKFKTALEKETGEIWSTCECVSNKNYGGVFQTLVRYLKYFFFPFKIYRKRNHYQRIVAWQQFYGLSLAWYLLIFKIKNAPEITVMTFIYKAKKHIWGKLYERFVRGAITSGYIKRIIVYSQAECEHYPRELRVPKEYFVSTKLGIADEKAEFETNKGNYYIAPGRSNRDYAFLCQAWTKLTGKEKLEIACDSFRGESVANIAYKKECYGKEYLEKLANCFAVIVPLADEKISSGQLVILQAMMFGKPVIATSNDTIKEYITNGQDGIIIGKNVEELQMAMLKLKNPQFYKRMSANARKKFEDTFSLFSLGEKVGTFLKQEKMANE